MTRVSKHDRKEEWERYDGVGSWWGGRGWGRREKQLNPTHWHIEHFKIALANVTSSWPHHGWTVQHVMSSSCGMGKANASTTHGTCITSWKSPKGTGHMTTTLAMWPQHWPCDHNTSHVTTTLTGHVTTTLTGHVTTTLTGHVTTTLAMWPQHSLATWPQHSLTPPLTQISKTAC